MSEIDNQVNNDDNRRRVMTTMIGADQAAAIAEVSVMPGNFPTTAMPGPRGGGTGGGRGGRRGTNEADEALLAGDVQNLDEAGVQVRSLFLEFLYQL